MRLTGRAMAGQLVQTWGWILNHRSAQAPNGGPRFVGPHARWSAVWRNCNRGGFVMSSETGTCVLREMPA